MWDRIASVEYAGRAGAGCVVAPGVILTARHLVECAPGHENEPRIVQISDHRGEGPRARAEIAWERGRIALLRCRPRDLGMEFAPLRWGELACTKPPAPRPECSAVGLPHEAMRRLFGQLPDGEADFRQPQGVTGRITTVDNASRIYTLQVDHQPPEHLRTGGSPWQGMAGAAVFCGELLIGVVADPPSGWSHGRLEAVPARQLLEDRGFCDILEAAGGTRPQLEAADLDGLLDGRPRPAAAASYLLSPRSETVGFLGLDAELGGLTSWCHTPPSVDVAVLQGEGGSGKTRLGTELARRLTERRAEAECDPSGPDVPWTAGFLSEAPDAHPAPYGMLRSLTRPALIVVDDAENRLAQVEELLTALAEHQAPPGRRIRVLLTARCVRGWWEQLQDRHPRLTNGTTLLLDPGAVYRHYTPAQVQELAELAFSRRILALHRAGVNDDWDAYEAADRRAALPHRTGHESPGDGVPGILTVHMEALASVLLNSPGEPTDGHAASATLLDHELHYVQRTAAAQDSHDTRQRETAKDIDEEGGNAAAEPGLLRTLVTVQSMAGAQNTEEADAVVTVAWKFHHRDAPRPLDPGTLLTLRRTAAALYPAPDSSHLTPAGPTPLTAALIDRAEAESDGRFLAAVLPSATLSPAQRRRSLTAVARCLPTHTHLVRATAEAVAAHPDMLAGPAADIARQLPTAWQVAWLRSIEKASPKLTAQERTTPADEKPDEETPGEEPAQTEAEAPVDVPAGSADGDVEQAEEPWPDTPRVESLRAEDVRAPVRDTVPPAPAGPRREPPLHPADTASRTQPAPAPAPQAYAPSRTERFWDSVNTAGAFSLLVMISIPLAVLVSVLWVALSGTAS